MRRHPLSDAAREYRSAMWLLAGIAVVAYAVGYAGVRGAVPRLVGLARAEHRRRHHRSGVLLRAPRPPPCPHRPGNILRAHHDRPPRRGAGQQGRRDARVDHAPRRAGRRRGGAHPQGTSRTPGFPASKLTPHVLPAGPRQYPHAQRSAVHASVRRARRRDGSVHAGAVARAAASRADRRGAPRRALCLRPAAAPLPRRAHRRSAPPRALSPVAGSPRPGRARTRAASPERRRHARRVPTRWHGWSPSTRATPATAPGCSGSARTMSPRRCRQPPSRVRRVADLATDPDGWLVEDHVTLVRR